MGLIISTSNFTGYQEVATSVAENSTLNAYIARYEKYYIYRIFGQVMGDALIASLTGSPPAPPTSSIYSVIFLPFCVQQQTGDVNYVDGEIHQSLGLVDALTCLIFFHYVMETQAEMGQAGVEYAQADGARVLSPREAARFAERKWNGALDSIDAIQWYCRFYTAVPGPNVYTKFAGVPFEPQYDSLM